MTQRGAASRRNFTAAARAAAIEARRRKRDLAVPKATPEVFVVRLPGAGRLFGWEIRRFGAIVIDRGATAHPTTWEARLDGEEALTRHGVDA